MNEIHRSGDIYLEPIFGHFSIQKITKTKGSIIVDKELLYAGTTGLNFMAVAQRKVGCGGGWIISMNQDHYLLYTEEVL